MKNHYSIKPMKAYLNKGFLFNKVSNDFIDCTIIGICLYENEALCFDIVLDDGSIFNYIPLDKIYHNKNYDKFIVLKDIVYHNCQSCEITLNHIEYLNDMKICYLKTKDSWIDIDEYIITIDWYRGNDLLNLVKLRNGFFALLPNHKIKMNLNKTFEKYLKIKTLNKV